FTSDAVHSDAELQKIIERLQHDDAHSADQRSQRTAAEIPPMALGSKQRALLYFDNDSHLISDPLTHYHARVPAAGTPLARRTAYCNNGDSDHYWTAAEASAFVAAYLAHPKQFGRIAAALPYKSRGACVLFYYRNKKPLRLKELLAARGAKRKRTAGSSGGGGGGSRRRKERTRERRERRARERAAEAAAAQPSAADEDAPARRATSSALLRSIIAANRRRKQGGGADGSPEAAGSSAEEGELPGEAAQAEPPALGPPDVQRAPSPEEVIEASGRVTVPRVVSRKSASRFGATLTLVPDGSPAASAAPRGSALPAESALDRFVMSSHSALRPISSYETLRMCSEAHGEERRKPVDAELVEAQCGAMDSVLVGAAAWARDDRRRALSAFHRLGDDFAQVAVATPGKTPAQCRYFFYHYRTPAGSLLCDALAGAGASPQPTPITAPVPVPLPLPASLPPVDVVAVPEPPPDAVSDEDDETPLAAQLASELAQQQQQHAAPPKPELLLPRAPLSSLVLPPAASPATAAAAAPAATSPAASSPASLAAPLTAKKSGYSSYWSVHERSAFLHYVERLGQDWHQLAEAIGTKTGTQVRNYFRANREKLSLDAVLAEYARNKAAGTLPPMTPFAPPAGLPPASASTDAGSPGVMGEERRERRGRKRKAEGVQPATAPASVASFAMGVDGGRAVVVPRPWPDTRRTASVAPDSPLQPTPPPVAGLRLSSSPPPAKPASVLHITNLTTHDAHVHQEAEEEAEQEREEEEEPRHVSVRGISALLNDDLPQTPRAVSSAEWFGDAAQAGDEEATGMAALALASMGQALDTSVHVNPHPPAHHTRPSSVGPSAAYPAGMSPALGRQRKPSAPLPAAPRYPAYPEPADNLLLLPRPAMPPSAGRRVTASSAVYSHRTVLPPPMQVPRDAPMQQMFSPGHRPMHTPHHGYYPPTQVHLQPVQPVILQPVQNGRLSVQRSPRPVHMPPVQPVQMSQVQIPPVRLQMQQSPQSQPPHAYPQYHPHHPQNPHQRPPHAQHPPQTPHQHPPHGSHQHQHPHHGQYPPPQ
ncbi:DNA-binding protein snt1, partial [Coemansia sp. RSA 2703]